MHNKLSSTLVPDVGTRGERQVFVFIDLDGSEV